MSLDRFRLDPDHGPVGVSDPGLVELLNRMRACAGAEPTETLEEIMEGVTRQTLLNVIDQVWALYVQTVDDREALEAFEAVADQFTDEDVHRPTAVGFPDTE